MRIPATRKGVTTRRHSSLFLFQTLSYPELFHSLEATEQAPQPERTNIPACLSTVGGGFTLQGSDPFIIGHSESLVGYQIPVVLPFLRIFPFVITSSYGNPDERDCMGTIKRCRCMISYQAEREIFP